MNLPNGVTNRIILIRHGEPVETAKGICYGKLDIGLAECGKTQTEATAKLLSKFEITSIYASPRLRAQETAKIIAAKIGLFYKTEPKFAEIDFGDFEGLRYEEVEQKFPAIYRTWMETPTEAEFPNGESFVQMQTRVLNITENLRQKHIGETCVFVSHGGVNRIILAHFLKMQNADIFRLEQNYACLNQIDFYGDFPLIKMLNRCE